MDFRNSTQLDDRALHAAFVRHTFPYRHDGLTVRVRYSRGADFSGSCYYEHGRIFINLGRKNCYPYAMGTHLAKATSNATHWWRETLTIHLADPFQLVLFIYMHELFHYLVKKAGRNPRRKEAMCDRFAARVLVDDYGCVVRRRSGEPASRELWDFQDLDRFVASAPRQAAPRALSPRAERPIPVLIRGL